MVVPLVGAGARLGRSVGLRPGEETLEDRIEPEHASGRVVLRDDGVLDPQPAQAVARLEPAGAAPDDDDGIVPRRKRPLVCWLTPAEDVAEPARHGLEHPVASPAGTASRNASSFGPGISSECRAVRATTSAVGLHSSSVETSPKKSPRRSLRGSLVPGDLDGRLAVQDDVEPAAGEPASEHPLAGAEVPLQLRVGDRLEVGIAEIGEERQAGEAADEVVVFAHLAARLQRQVARREEDRLGERREGLDRVAQHVDGDLRADRQGELPDPLAGLGPDDCRADQDAAARDRRRASPARAASAAGTSRRARPTRASGKS